jgi:hypothetical protein
MAAGFASNAIYELFFGEPAQVVEAIESFVDLGIDRVTASPVDRSRFDAIAEVRASLWF